MKFDDLFESFLEDTVNLSEGRIRKLDEKVAVVQRVFSNLDASTGLAMADSEPQGSYAQKTIINPLNEEHGFDADLLIEFEDWVDDPKDLILAVRAALKASPPHKDIVRLRSRCVTLDYAGEFHLDVVPKVMDGPVPYIANRIDNEWEPTDPEGFTAWMEEQDEIANGYLVPAIRLIKYHRALKGRPKAKSVVLSFLLAERAAGRFSADYTDLPTTLTLLLEDLAIWCAQFGETAPVLKEPTCGAEFRVDDIDWGAFTRQLQSIGDRARAALGEEDQGKSLALWRKLFGSRFPAPLTEARVVKAALAPGEMDLLRDCGIPTLIENETVELASNVRPTDSAPGASIDSFTHLPKARQLQFAIARTSVEPPYDVYWKVKNNGEEARRLGKLRGEITPDYNGPSAYKEESTAYTGDHYVEIYIVKDKVCVARARQAVVIG